MSNRTPLSAHTVVILELALLVGIVYAFRIEESRGFPALFLLTAAGFLVHSFLPRSWRPPFFLALGACGSLLLLGSGNALWLVALSAVLLAVAHLPIPFRTRVMALVAVGLGLGLCRHLTLSPPWGGPQLWPVLASMFMFRLILYMHHIRHAPSPGPIWHRLSYFLMLPNLCFTLFPVIDYSTFLGSYYDSKEREIYQKGVRWILRGILQLIAYRFVYLHLNPEPTRILDVNGLALFLATNYLLYMRISGHFHIIAGMLCLFGFDLPETHHLYLLPTSFTDYWRRINIYWKDFMVKICYFPVFMHFRHRGFTFSLVVATGVVFLATWVLHAYQWFWLRGTLSFPLQDVVFWAVLGSLVVVNALWEQGQPKRLVLRSRAETLTGSLVRAATVAGTFVVISVLWSLWTSPNVGAWLVLWRVDVRGWPVWSGFTVLALTAVAVGTAVVYMSGRRPGRFCAGLYGSWSGSAVATVLVAGALLVFGALPAVLPAEAGPAAFAKSLQDPGLNPSDGVRLVRGYYEDLLSVNQFTTPLWEMRTNIPRDWKPIEATGASRFTHDMQLQVLLPWVEVTFHGARFCTNRWGFRDREYELGKSPGTYRIAILGGSEVLGAGIANDEVFEEVLEERLNRERPGSNPRKYEILNFAMVGYMPISRRLSLERKAFLFHPDAVFYFAHKNEKAGVIDSFVDALKYRKPIAYPYLSDCLTRAGADRTTPPVEVEKRLTPLLDEILAWVYRGIVDECRRRGAVPVWIYMPLVWEEGLCADPALRQLAEGANFTIIDLSGVFHGLPQTELRVADWDEHANARAHRLLAERLYRELHKPDVASALGVSETPTRRSH